MSSKIRIYRLDEFIRVDETGIIDVEKSKQLIRQLAVLCGAQSAENILVDMRKTKLSESIDFTDLVDIAAEFGRYSPSCTKIANVIPDNERRISIAEQLRDIIRLHRDTYQIFTTFEQAIDWLAEIEN